MRETPNALTVSEDFEFKALSLADNYRAALLGEFSKALRGRVLEVGAGIGQVTEALLQNPNVTRLISIEPHPVFSAQLQSKFPGHTIVNGTINRRLRRRLKDARVEPNHLILILSP